MKESQVLVIGFSNCCTELARHLALSGVNLTIMGQEEVSPEDYLDEFLVTKEDATKKKGEVIVQKLSEMNPFAKINFSDSSDLKTLMGS